ncbi:MBL fold metallo-hydrolase RNA specificity domain-containing protein [Rufibacter quisquiliarum]|uniref:Metallo-beta-lactamase family protein n=1 Tax=Rufibacter quisquiliarum TaxID=1549639 RepID=A0A839GF93_9BACT|nr:MBL fold metallo-hydrolase [Rufibacter quisquiliarum]MBA9077180.1 metallo-beta-lactamase family protein [Rufibacter quisquiliarum]
MKNQLSLSFLGAAGTVTGSKYLLSACGKNILIDCGLYQGKKELRLLNWEEPDFPPQGIDVVLLTHAHLDHTGYLPKLVQLGYRGEIWATAPTLDVAEIILKDTAKIQEEEAKQANEQGYSKHHPAVPFYGLKDVEKTIRAFRMKPQDKWIPLGDQLRCRFRYNGHLLGACFLELDVAGKRLVFSSDVGRPKDVLLFSPHKPEKADILLLESTYGDRLHPTESTKERLREVITNTLAKKGTLLIPSFAVERAQALMYLLWQLKMEHALPSIPVILDTPMGADVLKVFYQSQSWHKLTAQDCLQMCEDIRIVTSFRETWEIIDRKEPKIVIAGSGMLTGGRILTYLTQYLENPATTILLAGYQAEGTRGRQLEDGAKELKIYGKTYAVKADVCSLEGLSGHADQQELLDWLSELQTAPEQIFLVHGEPDAAAGLQKKIRETLGWECAIPQRNEQFVTTLPQPVE